MLDFSTLPPEVNSARMYAGPGSGHMMAAATAWDGVAGQLESLAAGYAAELTALQGQAWSGSASAAMAAAAAPYMAWANATATQAEQTASQHRAAAAAYEAAFAATVPPPVIAANRALLMALIATNFLGQNTPAIAATEAHYAEMWAQDATAMHGYAGSSLPAAAALTPFNTPPQTANLGGQSAQRTAATQTAQTALSHALTASSHLGQSVSASSSTAASTSSSGSSGIYYINSWQSLQKVVNLFHESFTAQYYNYGVTFGDQTDFNTSYLLFGNHLFLPRNPPFLLGEGAFTSSTSAHGEPVLASTGKAASVGKLSVPRSWAGATPAPKAGYVAQSPQVQATGTGPQAVPAELVSAKSATPTPDHPALPPALGPVGGPAQYHSGNAVFRMRENRFRMPRPAAGG